MIGKTHRRFWKCFEALPEGVKKLAREKYALWKTDPYHPCWVMIQRIDCFGVFHDVIRPYVEVLSVTHPKTSVGSPA